MLFFVGDEHYPGGKELSCGVQLSILVAGSWSLFVDTIARLFNTPKVADGCDGARNYKYTCKPVKVNL